MQCMVRWIVLRIKQTYQAIKAGKVYLLRSAVNVSILP